MELYAKIKDSSKYAYQGRDRRSGKAMFFPIDSVEEGYYAFRMGGNQYRREDLAFYVKSGSGKPVCLSES